MRVLLTGHRGYIGTVLTPLLLDAGHSVVGLDSDLYRSATFGEEPAVIPTIEKDVRDVTARDVEGFDAVLHLAGLSNDPLGYLNPGLTHDINTAATIKLAKLAKQAGVERFVFSSSCSTYGAAGEDYIDETAAFNPVTPYGESKCDSEAGLMPLAGDGFTPVFLRNATAFGYSPRIRFDLVLNNLVAWAVTTGRVRLKSDGSPWRPIVHVEDIASAFVAVMEAPAEVVFNKAYNVGMTSENYRVREIAQIVADVVPGCELEIADGAGPDVRTYRVNCDLIQQEVPTYTPRWTARMGAEQLYDAYTRIGLTLDEFEGARYRRITHIETLMAAGKLGTDLRWMAATASGDGSLVQHEQV
ncbi:MAG: SDR family oxidoreductase [Bacteroidota bacterium]